VLRLASVLWRLRRATGIESALFEQVVGIPDKGQDEKSARVVVELTAGADGRQLKLVETQQPDHIATDANDCGIKSEIGDRFLHLAELPTFPLDRLSRYEHLLWRQARQLVFTLESLGRRRSQPRRSRSLFHFDGRTQDAEAHGWQT